MTSFDIGLKLAITERTVNFHFSNIISKMGVLNRLEAIAMGVAHGLIQVDARAAPLKPLRASKIRDAQLKRWEARRNNGKTAPVELRSTAERLTHRTGRQSCNHALTRSHCRNSSTEFTLSTVPQFASASRSCAPYPTMSEFCAGILCKSEIVRRVADH